VAAADVESVRSLVAAFNEGDAEKAFALLDPDIEFHSILLGGTVYRGHEGMAEYARDLRETWEGWHSEDDRFVDAGDGRVLWLYRIVGYGAGSGVPVEAEVGILWTVRGGRLVRGEAHQGHAAALEAAGLED